MTGSFHATFARGGTSNGLVVLRSELPDDTQKWEPILAAAMGSPDPNWRQLNGIGSGISSTSKVCVIEASKRADIDIDYTFVQVGVDTGKLSLAGNCGNMSSVVGPVALNEGLVDECRIFKTAAGNEVITVRVFNTNTGKVIHATFKVQQLGGRWSFDGAGDYAIAGVPGTASKISLCFLDPAGTKTGKALPSGNPIDILDLSESDGGPIQASLVDIANPAVFIWARDLGIDGDIKPDELQTKTSLMHRLEKIRQAGAERMGMDPSATGVPFIAILSTPSEKAVSEGIQLQVRALSMQQAHKTIPGTLTLNIGSARRIPGTLPAQLACQSASEDSMTISHPGGLIEVGSILKDDKIESAVLHRTAKILMKGKVYY